MTGLRARLKFMCNYCNHCFLRRKFLFSKYLNQHPFLSVDGKVWPGQKVFLEVKNVPLADVVDISSKERKRKDLSQYDLSKKIAIFPDGYRKNKSEPISARALKHVNHLASIRREDPNIICALLYLI